MTARREPDPDGHRFGAVDGMTLHFSENGAQVPRNYHQARKQRELARKARQQEKQQRRAARPSTAGENTRTTAPVVEPGAPRDPTSGRES